MRIKEIQYMSADSLPQLQAIVQIRLNQGWSIINPVSFLNGGYVQELGMQYSPTETHMIMTEPDVHDIAVNHRMKKGYTLFGQPFAVDGQLCQALLRWE